MDLNPRSHVCIITHIKPLGEIKNILGNSSRTIFMEGYFNTAMTIKDYSSLFFNLISLINLSFLSYTNNCVWNGTLETFEKTIT